MRLTDADALKQTFCAECDHSIKCEDCDIDYHFEHLAPTIDAVEVVRCKDCVYATRNDWGRIVCAVNNEPTLFSKTEDYFCAWGRREDGIT